MRSTKCHWCGEDYNDCNRCTHRGVYVEPARLALLERCAERWAESKICRISNGEGYFDFSCDQCGRVSRSTSRSDYEHAANCDAALILGLDREAKG